MYSASVWTLLSTWMAFPWSEQPDPRICTICLLEIHLHRHPTATIPMFSLNSLSIFFSKPEVSCSLKPNGKKVRYTIQNCNSQTINSCSENRLFCNLPTGTYPNQIPKCFSYRNPCKTILQIIHTKNGKAIAGSRCGQTKESNRNTILPGSFDVHEVSLQPVHFKSCESLHERFAWEWRKQQVSFFKTDSNTNIKV